MDSIPILSLTAFAPVIGAAAIFLIRGVEREQARVIALVAMLVSFVLSVAMILDFDRNAEFQYTENVKWLDDLGVSYSMGIDGIAVLLIGLTTLIGVIAVVWSWNSITYRGREYYITLLLLQTGMLGVFMALDLFVFYIFWELVLIPMALLIGIWGSENRVFAATKFFLYTLIGSLLMLIGIVATYQWYYERTGVRTLNILDLQQGWDLGAYSSLFQGHRVCGVLYRFCHQDSALAVPYLVARCARASPDRGVGRPGRCHAQDGWLRSAPVQPAVVPGRGRGLGADCHRVVGDRHHLRRRWLHFRNRT